MSKQLNFFIIPDDLESIYDFLNSNGVKYLNERIKNVNNLVQHPFPFEDRKLNDRMYLTSGQFLDHLNFNYNEESHDYSLDREKSYILEFNPGGFYPSSPNVLHRARFYCKTSYFVSNGESIVKSDDFKSWVAKLFLLFKKQFLIKTDASKSILFSGRTLVWMKENNGQIDVPFLKITI